jgi:hypothetical protein
MMNLRAFVRGDPRRRLDPQDDELWGVRCWWILECGNLTGAAKDGQTPEPLAKRNGYHDRDWIFRAGKLRIVERIAYLEREILIRKRLWLANCRFTLF